MDSEAIELRNLKTSRIGLRDNQNVEQDLSLSGIRNRSYSAAIGRHNENPFESTSLNPGDEMNSNQALEELQDVSQEGGQVEINDHSLSWKELIFGITLENINSTARDHVSILK